MTNAEVGTIGIILALGLTLYAGVGSFWGARTQNHNLLTSSRRAVYAAVLPLAMSTIILVVAFLQHDFSIRYVAEHSSTAMPGGYIWVAFYAGNEGSLLYVAMVLAAVAAATLKVLPPRLGLLLPYTNLVLMIILSFYLLVLATLANPFTLMAVTPEDGRGINPLLTHPGMFIHPPMIMLGLIATSIPFALAMAGLLAKKIDDDWVDWGRAWGMIAWALLGIGLLLGAWWAYTILGWGGYWAWDPVENAALMPWLGLTAFIHSIMVQKRRGMFRMWNIILINTTFALGNFGIFINRGGPVPSVHSFGASSLGWVFLSFLAVTVILSFGLFFYRLGILKSSQRLESLLSREAAFLVNNLLLLGVAFITLWGVIFPLISELVSGKTITVTEPFYNQINGPILLTLIVLMGIGPLLPWRNATWTSIRRAVAVPVTITLLLVLLLFILGVTRPIALVGFGASGLVGFSILQEWVRGSIARHKVSGKNYFLSFSQLMTSNRPRYGGYIVHLAIVMLAFGIIGSSFYDLERDVILPIGGKADIGRYTVEFERTNSSSFSDRIERTATMRIYHDGKFIENRTAWQAIYPEFRMMSTRAAIRSTPVEDLYILFSELQPDGSSAAFRLLVNPLVWWMWVAGPVLIFGTIFALWPSKSIPYSPSNQRRKLLMPEKKVQEK